MGKSVGFDAARIAKNIRTTLLSFFLLLGIWYLVHPFFGPSLFFSPRWIYGAAIAMLASCALVLDRRNRWAASLAIVYFLLFDHSLYHFSTLMQWQGYGVYFKPEKAPSIFSNPIFTLHPLLKKSPRPDYRDETYSHTSVGTRVVEPRDESCPLHSEIALVGGSSTYGSVLAQGSTWPDFLQRKLCTFRVWNYGVPGFTTAEHIIQTAMHLPARNIQCAVYFVGWNDLRSSFLPHLGPDYSDYHFADVERRIRLELDRAPLPTFKLVNYVMSFFEIDPPRPAPIGTLAPRSGSDPRLVAIFARNVNSIIALNRQHGIRAAFIGQLMNYHALGSAQAGRRYGWFPVLEDRGIPEALDHLNAVLGEVAQRNNVPFLLPRQDWLDAKDYADYEGHFSRSGAEKFAARVADFVEHACSRDTHARGEKEDG